MAKQICPGELRVLSTDHAPAMSSVGDLFEEVEHGADHDLKTAIEIIGAAAKLISSGIDLYLKWPRKPPWVTELSQVMLLSIDSTAPAEINNPAKIELVAAASVRNPPKG